MVQLPATHVLPRAGLGQHGAVMSEIRRLCISYPFVNIDSKNTTLCQAFQLAKTSTALPIQATMSNLTMPS